MTLPSSDNLENKIIMIGLARLEIKTYKQEDSSKYFLCVTYRSLIFHGRAQTTIKKGLRI